MGVLLTDLVNHLNEYLRVDDIPDYGNAHNGLQVEGPSEVSRIAVGVDACLATIAGAALWGTDLLIVHHGLFWEEQIPITGTRFRRVSALIKHRMGLYASHLPLDVHPVVGNGVVLARKLGLDVEGTFADHNGVDIGVYGKLVMERDELIGRLEDILEVNTRLLPHGLWETGRVGIISGAGGSEVVNAAKAGVDTFITGEAPHHAALEAEEYGMNMILAGHYATETLGVEALAEHLREEFDLDTQFIDHPTGL